MSCAEPHEKITSLAGDSQHSGVINSWRGDRGESKRESKATGEKVNEKQNENRESNENLAKRQGRI